jgi:excinuclease ABC subunit C
MKSDNTAGELIKEKLKRIPRSPGVYILKDASGKTLYVGKAKSLRDRLRSHFMPGSGEEPRHGLMMSKICDFETILTDSEIEALILEANFIKEHHPRYNVNLKDDKSYPYIRVTNEPYPRVLVTRKIVRDGSRYFGPYTDVGSMRQLLGAIRRIFPVRTCKLEITEESLRLKKHKICLLYHILRCQGPCEGLVPQQDYLWTVNQVVAFIQGRNSELKKNLESRMRDLAAQKRFEEAACLRDEIRSIGAFQSRQKVVDDAEVNRDIVVTAQEGGLGCGLVFTVRGGKIINRIHFFLENVDSLTESEILANFLKLFYTRTDDIPGTIMLPEAAQDSTGIEAWLSGIRGAGVSFEYPGRGKSSQLMDRCRENAKLLLNELIIQKEKSEDWTAPSVLALQKDLSLAKIPKHIEAFDISNLAGKHTVASMVVFENGQPKKSEYRKFKIRSVAGSDDFRSMAEVLERRMTGLRREGKPMPDLILVDGGKGQLSAAVAVLKKMNVEGQPVVGLAKRLEEVFIPGAGDAQNIPKSSAGLRLLQRVRDEAHRFAVAYHRTLRKKRAVHSELDDIPGIGEKRRKALLRHFGSVKNMRQASLESITSVNGMNRKAAEGVAAFFRKSAQ